MGLRAQSCDDSTSEEIVNACELKLVQGLGDIHWMDELFLKVRCHLQFQMHVTVNVVRNLLQP